MSRASTLFLVAVAVCSFVVTYNAIHMAVVHMRASITAHQGAEWEGGGDLESSRGSKSGRVSRKTGTWSEAVLPRPKDKVQKGEKRLFHVAVTTNESPYNRWQCRIHYYW